MDQAMSGKPDEWDIPLGGLAGMTRVQLGRTHIEVATAEARFLSNEQQLSQDVAAAVWEGFGTEQFPLFEPTTQTVVTVPITPMGVQAISQSQQGWMLSTADRNTAITLLPSTVVVQTRAYARYSSSLGDPLAKVLALFTAATGPSRLVRLGLRYVNRLTSPDASAPIYWRDHIRAPFAGALHGPTANLVVGVHQQTLLRLGDTASARVQSGVFDEPASPSPRYSFLVDLDVFLEQTQNFDSTLCANQVRQLNRTALALFAEVLSEQYLADLGPVPVAPNTAPAGAQEGGTAS